MVDLKEKKERFSYSRLECFSSCGYRYNLRYNQKLYISPPTLAAYYGTLVHKILEREANTIKYMGIDKIDYDGLKDDFVNYDIPKKNKFDRDGDIYGTKKLAEMFAKQWKDNKTKSGKNFTAKANDFLISGIYNFPMFMEENPTYEVLGAEVSFEFEYRGYIFNGFIDRLLYDTATNTYIIHDIKTKDHPFTDKELTTPLQFYIYRKALEDMYGTDIKVVCFYDLPVIGLRQAAGTKGWEKRGAKKLDKLIDGIEAGEYKPSPSPLCYWCEFCNINPDRPEAGKNRCPYYSLWTPTNRDLVLKEFDWEGPENHEKIMKKFLARKEQEEKAGMNKKTKFTIEF